MSTIRKATASDLEHIRGWLQQEKDDDHESFIVNIALIERGQESGSLTTLLEDDLPIAFALGDSSIDVFAVKRDRRNSGVGRELASHWIEDALERDIIGFEGECSPSSSLGFWKKMGFTQVKSDNHHPRIIMALGQSREIPADREQINLRFELFDSNGHAIPGWDKVRAAIIDKDDYMLERDFIAYVPDCRANLFVLSDEPPIYKIVKVCDVEDVGGTRAGCWIRIRDFWSGPC